MTLARLLDTIRPHNRWAGAKALRERWQTHIDASVVATARKQGWNILQTLIAQPHAFIQALSA